MTRIRYSIIRIQVDQLRQIVEINHKLPAHLKVCTGFVVRHTKGLTTAVDLPEIGLITLEFNSRKRLFANDLIGLEASPQSLPGYKPLRIPLESGQLVTGYYMDTGMIAPGDFAPYQVSVYLRCEMDESETASVCTTTSATFTLS